MAFQLLSACAATTILLLFSITFLRYLRKSQTIGSGVKPTGSPPELTGLGKTLASVLPDNVIFPHDTAAFKRSMSSYWAQQECEVTPACVVRPCDIQQLCTAVTILKREFDERGKQTSDGKPEGLFAIRSGGHSPVPGAASIKEGVLIDLGLLCDVVISEDGLSVAIGAGAKWIDVSRALEEEGLAAVGGRNSDVGVGGLTLGGGISFFSPRFGLVCSNILSYEIVLASGSIATASATVNPDLWRALKGGSNNFGIVTRFKARSFPCTKIWSGFLYMPASQATKVLIAFHDCVNRADSGSVSTSYDSYVAGPIACFSYVQNLGVQAIAVNLVHTNPPENGDKWPIYWMNSPFRSVWRLWSTFKLRTLSSATDEMSGLNPPGRRQVFATTTIKNDHATIVAAHTAYYDAIASIRRVNVKGLVWTLVLQPLLPEWARKGDTNPLGSLDGTYEPLVIVSFTVNWDKRRDDEFVKMTTRRAVEQIDTAAATNGTGHRYRCLNYCAEWQRPFESYGKENWRFLQGVSRRYDPDGLFQRGCVGGFKLGIVHNEATSSNRSTNSIN